jgi:hypothetical protein
MPPTTPPTMAPTGVDLCVGPLEVLDDDEPLFGDADVGVDERILLVDVGLPIVRAKIVSRLLLLNPPTGRVAVAPPDLLQNDLSAIFDTCLFRNGQLKKQKGKMNATYFPPMRLYTGSGTSYVPRSG